MILEPNDIRSQARLKALKATALLDSSAEEAFDRFTRLAARLLATPVALISLVDADRQFFKSAVGLPEPWASARETPLSHSFCKHTVTSGKALIVNDARQHPLVRDNQAIKDLGVVAYAGAPLTTSDGYNLGAFCAIDNHARQWSPDDVQSLRDLAALVMREIELTTTLKTVEELIETNKTLDTERFAILDATGDGVYGVDHKGTCTYANTAACKMLGFAREDLVGNDPHALMHHTRPDGSLFPRQQCPIYAVTRTGMPHHSDQDVFWKKSGKKVWVRYSAVPIVIEGKVHGVVVSFSDISARLEKETLRSDLSKTILRELEMPINELRASLRQLSADPRPIDRKSIAAANHCLIELQAKLNDFEMLNKQPRPTR